MFGHWKVPFGLYPVKELKSRIAVESQAQIYNLGDDQNMVLTGVFNLKEWMRDRISRGGSGYDMTGARE
jgi:hypothetical protein